MNTSALLRAALVLLLVTACTVSPPSGGEPSSGAAVACAAPPRSSISPPAGDSVIAAIDLGCEAGGVAAAGNSIWVVPHLERVALRVDPASNTVADRTPLGDRGPGAEIAGDDAMVWASVSSADYELDRLVRIDPVTGDVVAWLDVAAGFPVIGAGYAWAGTYDTVHRIDPATNAVAGSIEVDFGCWVIVLDDRVFCIGSGNAVEIDPAADEVTPVEGVPPGLPVEAMDGLVWGVNDDSLWAFNIATLQVEVDLRPPAGAATWSLEAVVVDGELWASAGTDTKSGPPDRLVRIDRDRMEIDCIVETPASEFGIAAGFGSIWLPALREHWLVRIDPQC